MADFAEQAAQFLRSVDRRLERLEHLLGAQRLQMLTTRQAAEYLGLSHRTIHRLVSERKIPSHRPPGSRGLLFKAEDLENFRTSGRRASMTELEAEAADRVMGWSR